jgi:hypothetical protein
LFDEANYRRENFSLEHSTPLVLSDGGTWYFPRPVIAIHPTFRQGKPTGEHWEFFEYGAELDDLIASIGQTEDHVERVVRIMALAAKLLLHHYDLPDDVLAKILVFRDDDASLSLLRTVINIATGNLVSHGGRGVLDDPFVRLPGVASPC